MIRKENHILGKGSLSHTRDILIILSFQKSFPSLKFTIILHLSFTKQRKCKVAKLTYVMHEFYSPSSNVNTVLKI